MLGTIVVFHSRFRLLGVFGVFIWSLRADAPQITVLLPLRFPLKKKVNLRVSRSSFVLPFVFTKAALYFYSQSHLEPNRCVALLSFACTVFIGFEAFLPLPPAFGPAEAADLPPTPPPPKKKKIQSLESLESVKCPGSNGGGGSYHEARYGPWQLGSR